MSESVKQILTGIFYQLYKFLCFTIIFRDIIYFRYFVSVFCVCHFRWLNKLLCHWISANQLGVDNVLPRQHSRLLWINCWASVDVYLIYLVDSSYLYYVNYCWTCKRDLVFFSVSWHICLEKWLRKFLYHCF